MTGLFYLQDSRTNVGSRAMFWRNGGGYTSNLDEAEQFTREQAVNQYECRESDLPWPVAYVNRWADVGVDHQYLRQAEAEQADIAAGYYAAAPQDWDGNDLLWRSSLDNGYTANLKHARIFSPTEAVAAGVIWPVTYINSKSRRVVRAALLDHRSALSEVGLKLKKIKPQKIRRYRYRCEPCGRFLTEYQNYTECPNCGAENRP
jgi:hypothetical protein